MQILRTPDERFADLPDFPWPARYVEVDGPDAPAVRMAYVEAGPADGPVVVLLHGEPSWSFLYRKMIGPLSVAGCRVLAPDLIGFGRSDKPAATGDYSYARHVAWIWSWFVQLDLRDVTLFCQDWGGLIGLRIVGEHPERFARVVAGNTFLPTGDQPLGKAFEVWREYCLTTPTLEVGAIVGKGTARGLSADVQAAYDAPFPDDTFKAGARVFPALVPASPDDPAAPANRAAWESLMRFEKPFVTAFGDSDPITRGADGLLQALIPGTRGQSHVTIERAGHFLQEDAGAELAAVVLRTMGR